MCISAPKVGATNSPAPTDLSASNLQLGTSALFNQSGGIFGRLALTGGQQAQRAANASAGSASGSTTTSSPGGTLGLPSDYLGQPVFGGLKPKV